MDDSTRNVIGAMFGVGSIMFALGLWMFVWVRTDSNTGDREKAFFADTAIVGAIWLVLAGIFFFLAHVRFAL